MSKILSKKPYALELAEFIHERYEYHAASFGWSTNEKCQVPFDALPEANQRTMIAVARDILKKFSDMEKQAQEYWENLQMQKEDQGK